jgi:hypothetical protein
MREDPETRATPYQIDWHLLANSVFPLPDRAGKV